MKPSWGLEILVEYAGFWEFLLDGSTEDSKKTKEWKFAVIDAIVASAHNATLLNPMQRNTLMNVFAKGPFMQIRKGEEPQLQAI